MQFIPTGEALYALPHRALVETFSADEGVGAGIERVDVEIDDVFVFSSAELERAGDGEVEPTPS